MSSMDVKTVEVSVKGKKIMDFLLKEGKSAQKYVVGEVAKGLGEDLEKLIPILSDLSDKGLLKLFSEETERVELTSEGLLYAKDGLPEWNLLKILRDRKKRIEEIRETLGKNGAKIGLTWCMRNKWVKSEKTDKGALFSITAEGLEVLDKGLLEQKLLEKIAQNLVYLSDLNPEEIGVIGKLLDRNLLKKKIERKYSLSLSKALLEGKIEPILVVTALNRDLILSGAWKKARLKRYNLSARPPTTYIARKQPYLAFLDELKVKLVSLGFQEMIGPLVEPEFWNFDALYQPQDHPARTWSATYSIKKPAKGKLPPGGVVERVKSAHEDGCGTGSIGWRYKWSPEVAAKLMLRAQGTSLSARTLLKAKPPSKYFAIARCYRPDVVDATHLSEFNQVEGIVVDEDLTFRDLLGILKMFAVEIAKAEDVKFIPDYYPFTEPSVQLSAKHPEMGWVEFGGAGIFRPEVTAPPKVEVPVLAWGLGVDRLYMVKAGIHDIRNLFNEDLGWMRRSKVLI